MRRAKSCLEPLDVRRIEPGNLAQPLGVLREATHQDRDALGDGEMAVAQEPREPLVEADVVRTMPELVEHRVGPVAVVGNVREHADVALAVDVDAERVLALAVAREEVAAVEDGIRVDAEAVVRGTRERHDVLAREHVREVDPTGRRHLLEEGSS